jgi:hypothetical protein
MWGETPNSFPALSRIYTCKEQNQKEKQLSRLIKDENLDQARLSDDFIVDFRRIKFVKRTMKTFRLAKLDDGQDFDVDSFVDKLYRATEEFSAMAKEFDPGVLNEEIHQALRNLWIINTIQICFGKPVSVLRSGFAYSMIYPYSDNYLDASEVSSGEKKDFCSRLERRLRGERPPCNNENDARIFRLIGMIESEFCRDRFKDVYESLLAIHHAQSSALRQQRMNDDLSAGDLLRLSVEKGGTSVLADGFIANGILGCADADFLFGFGVSLQLIDDLQDIEEDIANGHTSLLSLEAASAPLDGIVNRLLNFIAAILISPGLQKSPDACGIAHMIEKSSKALIFESIAKNPQLYSQSFVEKIERHSPLSFEYLLKMGKSLRSRYDSSPRVRLAVA